jgi:hypothetical protein
MDRITYTSGSIRHAVSDPPRADSALRLVFCFAAAHCFFTLIFLSLRLDLFVVLLAPLALLVPFASAWHPPLFSPLGMVLPVVFASPVWAVVLCGLYLLVRRFVPYRLGPRVVRLGRVVALLFAVVDLTYLFFGPLVGFAGDRIYGVLEPIQRFDGSYHVHPLWLALSILAWAAGFFAAYRFLIVTPATREITPTA